MKRAASNAAKSRPVARDESAGVIRPDEAYTLDAFKRRLDLTDSAWRSLVDSGIPHKQLGKRKIVLGKDVLSYLESLPDVSISTAAD